MDVTLSIDDWQQRRQRLEALTGADRSQRHGSPAQPDKKMHPELFSAAKESDVDKFIQALEHHCNRERVSLPIVLGLRSPSNSTLLHAAAESDDNVRAVIDFVPKHLISCQNSRGETPLHIAARAGKTGAVKLLLPRGNPRCTDRSGNSALHEAVRNRHYEGIRRLVSEDPTPLNSQNNESKSPWCLAVETGDLEVLKPLLNAPEDGEDKRRSETEGVIGMSPVHVAILHKKKKMLNRMWEKKQWLFQLRDAGGGTPLHLAANDNYLDGVKFLMEKCPESAQVQDGKDGYLPIHDACMMDRVGIVKELLRQWPDPAEFLTKLGQNILHVSAKYKGAQTVRYILKNPNFHHLINARDFDGNTPLHLAALHRRPSVVLLAGDERVDLGLVNKNNMTALDVVDEDIRQRFVSIGKWLTRAALTSASAQRSRELAICQPTGRRPRKRSKMPIRREGLKSQADSYAVVLALVASVTFTSAFSVPGGYSGSEGDAGMPILLHKAMYDVFVICNSIAMCSSITALWILVWSKSSEPKVGKVAIWLSSLPFVVTLVATPLAFVAGVYVTVNKLTWLSALVLVVVSIGLFPVLSVITLIIMPSVFNGSVFKSFRQTLLLFWFYVVGEWDPDPLPMADDPFPGE